MVFEEEKGWDWKRSDEEVKDDVFEWEEEEKVDENETVAVTEHQETPDPAPVQNRGESSNTGAENLGQGRSTRAIRAPGWMSDYVMGEGTFEEEDAPTHALMMMLMVAENDPVLFEDAVTQRIWREAMKSEIYSIEKNHTWELTSLPDGF